jgi:hypothetical protein
MMPRSLKVLDLARDGRFSLHSATTDKQATNGDAKIGGVARRIEDEATFAAFREAFAAATGSPRGGIKHVDRY